MLWRAITTGVACLVLLGCASPQPAALSSDQRDVSDWMAQLRSAEQLWLEEEARLAEAVGRCPGPARPLAPSPALARREAIRAFTTADLAQPPEAEAGRWARPAADRALQQAALGLALADWHVRRAAATREASRCEPARAALAAARDAMGQARAGAADVARTARLPGWEPATTTPQPAPVEPTLPPTATRLAVRLGSVEALPVVLARAAGVPAELGLDLRFIRVGTENPTTAVTQGAHAAVATSVDQLGPPDRELVDVFNFYDRPPVAVAVSLGDGASPAGTSFPGLTGLVVAAPDDGTLAARIARALRTEPGAPRFTVGGTWRGSLAAYGVGQVDGVLARAPLPQYLAMQRGAVLWDASQDPRFAPLGAGSLLLHPSLDPRLRGQLVSLVQRGTALLASQPAEVVVDMVAADFPEWEPDVLLEAAVVAQRCLNPGGQLRRQTLLRAAELVGAPIDAARADRLGVDRD